MFFYPLAFSLRIGRIPFCCENSLSKDTNSTNSNSNINTNLDVNELGPTEKTSDSTNTVSPTFLNK